MAWRMALSWAVTLAVALTGPASPSATAAIRFCSSAVTSTAVAGTELDAKKSALDMWKAEAEKLGAGYASWRLAADRILECKPASGGKIACVARGRPCTIEQAPNTRELRQKRLDI